MRAPAVAMRQGFSYTKNRNSTPQRKELTMSKHSIENNRKENHGQDKNNHDQHKHQVNKDDKRQEKFNEEHNSNKAENKKPSGGCCGGCH
jgi:hypothetical protein